MKIYYPNEKHIFTIIILHGMYGHSSNYETLVDNILNISKNIKIIVPNSPIRDIDWPAGKEYNVRSWYNYFTARNGEMQHDEIDKLHFQQQCNRIEALIEKELKVIMSGNIILIGESQGGTIVADLSISLKYRLAGYVLIDSIFMDNILSSKINVENMKKNIYIYSSENDEVYTLEFQKRSVNRLHLEKYIQDWFIDKDTKHCEVGPNRNKFILSIITSIFNLD